MRAILRILEAGPLASVQDAGRRGLLRFGVPRSGPMDRLAFAMANAALGNPPGAAALELSTGGLVVEAEGGPVTVALAGGDFRARTGDRLLAGWNVLPLLPGEPLAIRAGPAGNWAVLAVAGGIEAPLWLGSRATHAASGLGGGLLRPGLSLPLAGAALRADRHGPLAPPPDAAGPVRVVLGPQERFFAPGAVASLLTEEFRIGTAGDRMGRRLDGRRLPPIALDMASQGLVAGSVQIAGDGVATVLLADHQTTGGYPRIATVIGPDLDRVAQMRPGEALRFAAVFPAEAVRLARQDADRRRALIAGAALRDPGARLATASLIDGAVDARAP